MVRGGERMVTHILSPSSVPCPHCLRQANPGLKQSQAVPLSAPQCYSSPPQGQLRRTVSRRIIVSPRGLRNEVTGVPMKTAFPRRLLRGREKRWCGALSEVPPHV